MAHAWFMAMLSSTRIKRTWAPYLGPSASKDRAQLRTSKTMQSNVFNGIIAGGHKPFCKQATSYLLRRSNHLPSCEGAGQAFCYVCWPCSCENATNCSWHCWRSCCFPAKGPPIIPLRPFLLVAPLILLLAESLTAIFVPKLSHTAIVAETAQSCATVVVHTPCQRMVVAATTPMSVVLHRHEPPPWCWPWNHSQWRTASWTSCTQFRQSLCFSLWAHIWAPFAS